MLSMLIAYDDAGNVIATLDYMVSRDETGEPVGLIDFAAHEESGAEMTDVWMVKGAAGSKVWPEWLGGQAFAFRVEKSGPPGARSVTALVHRQSGYRRERAAVEAAVAERIAEANGAPADIRDLVGGPDRPLLLDDEGRVRQRESRPNRLPFIARRR